MDRNLIEWRSFHWDQQWNSSTNIVFPMMENPTHLKVCILELSSPIIRGQFCNNIRS